MPALPPINAAPGKGRRTLLLIAGLFALPFAVAAMLFAGGWRPASGGPHGELLADAAPLPLGRLRDADGRPLPADLLAGRWTLLVADGGPCAADCLAQLATVRRLHVALGKQMPRLRRVWLSTAPAADPQLAVLRAAYADLVVAAADDARWRSLMPASGPRFLVIDPAGRAVLGYAPGFDARGALHDVERLLKYSWIG